MLHNLLVKFLFLIVMRFFSPHINHILREYVNEKINEVTEMNLSSKKKYITF